MQVENSVAWDKLSVELEMLASETTSMLQLMMGLNEWLCPSDSMEWVTRTLKFMLYELLAQTEKQSEGERFSYLNEHFFRVKGFRMLQPSHFEEAHLLLRPVLEQRAGAPIAVTMIYLHLANRLNLPSHMIQLKGHYFLKWVRFSKISYIDLCAEGRLVEEEELISIINRKSEVKPVFEELTVIPSRKTFIRYAEELMQVYEKQDQPFKLLFIYNILMKIDPQNSRILGRRAWLHFRLGHKKLALFDLKKYFSFVEPQGAPQELVFIFAELNSQNGKSQGESVSYVSLH